MDSAYLFVAFGWGVASHVLYFNRYPYHQHIEYILAAAAAWTIGSPFALFALFGFPISHAFLTTAALNAASLIGAIGSTLIYRGFLNPLNKFPGPYTARFTNFWIFYTVGKKLNQYHLLDALHKKYGRYVRVGARNLSIADPKIFPLALGQNAVAVKGEFYDMEYPDYMLQTYRDKAFHDRQRRLWAPAFGDRALREYEGRVKSFNQKFMERISEYNGGPMNVSKWFNLYSFDVMGSLAFGKNYKMLESGEQHHALSLVTDGMSPVGLSPPIWFVRLAKMMPGDPAGFQKLDKFCAEELEDMVRNQSASEKSSEEGGSTISSWLYKNHQHKPHPEKDHVFVQEAKLLIVAGSDTTAASLTFIFFKLAQYPEHAEKIRQELRECIKGEEWSHKDIQYCQHLNAVIDEVLRLHSVGPSGLFRETPAEGMQVGDVFLPGNIAFQIPSYVLGRDEEVFDQALSFIPERFSTRPELIKIKGCYSPFIKESSFGCIGRNLALMEMRTLMAIILLKYDVSFAPGEDGYRLLNESKDHFTMSLAPLDLVFTSLKT